MSRAIRPSDRGFSLVEVLVATGVLALLALGLFSMLRGGARLSGKAGEVQIATILGARIVDRICANGYFQLRRSIGERASLDLSTLDGLESTANPEQGTLAIDGVRFRGDYQIEELDPGLLRLRVWLDRDRGPEDRSTGRLALTKFLVDPSVASATR